MPPEPVVPVPVQVSIVKQGANVLVQPPGEAHIGIDANKVPSVQLTNRTGDQAFLWFPNGDQLFDLPVEVKNADGSKGANGADFLTPILIPDGGTATLYTTANPNQVHLHYHVFCKAVNDCAQGNSEPKVGCP